MDGKTDTTSFITTIKVKVRLCKRAIEGGPHLCPQHIWLSALALTSPLSHDSTTNFRLIISYKIINVCIPIFSAFPPINLRIISINQFRFMLSASMFRLKL